MDVFDILEFALFEEVDAGAGQGRGRPTCVPELGTLGYREYRENSAQQHQSHSIFQSHSRIPPSAGSLALTFGQSMFCPGT